MRPTLIAVCASCAIVAVLAFWGWQRWLDTEVSLTEYGALNSLRRMDPVAFKERVLPELEKALADGRLTNKELSEINAKTSGYGTTALAAYQKNSWDEELNENLAEAQRKGAEAGRDIGETMNKAMDELSGFIQREFGDLFKSKKPPQNPSTF